MPLKITKPGSKKTYPEFKEGATFPPSPQGPGLHAEDRMKHHQLSNRIKHVLGSSNAYKIYAQYQCGPFDGCCVLVAKALAQFFQHNEFAAIYGYSKNDPSQTICCQHVTFYQARYCVDAGGIWQPDQLQSYWQTSEQIYGTGPLSLPELIYSDQIELININEAIQDRQGIQALNSLLNKTVPQRFKLSFID